MMQVCVCARVCVHAEGSCEQKRKGAKRSFDLFLECFHSNLTQKDLMTHMQSMVDAGGCHASKQSNAQDRPFYPSLPAPLLYHFSVALRF